MHSFLDLAEPHVQTILWVQVVGMPIAFIVRAFILLVRFLREPAENRTKNALRIGANLLFALSCWVFSRSEPVAAISFAGGVGLSIKAFIIARAQAIEIGKKVIAARNANASRQISIRDSRLSKSRQQTV